MSVDNNNSLNRDENQNDLFDVDNSQNTPDVSNENPDKRKNKKRKEKVSKHNAGGRIRVIVYTIILTLILASAMFILMCLDKGNYMRPEFLNDSIFVTIIEALGLERVNITRNAWVVFFTIAAAAFILLFAYFFCGKARRKFGKWASRATKTERGAKMLFGLVYFGILVLILAGIVVGMYMAGLYSFYNIDMAGKNVDGAELLLNVLYALGVFLGLFAILPLMIFFVFLVIKFLDLIIKLLSGAGRTESDKDKNQEEGAGAGGGAGGGSGGGGLLDKDSKITVVQEEKDMSGFRVFPSLTEIDKHYAANPVPEKIGTDIELKDMIYRLQSYLANKQRLYFNVNTLQCFIAGLSCTRLMILEGLSGTGKSSLPRFFMEFINSKVYFCAVQSTWRDRTDVVGYYNDFSKEFKETQFLKQLYRANYEAETINLMVLDEFNLSRIEYYFADFLSVLEYPAPDWKILLMQTSKVDHPPVLLDDGQVQIPLNTWFIGTANKDDSTFMITDKVYDRAVIIDFYQKNPPIHTDYESEPIQLTTTHLLSLFDKAQNTLEYRLNDEDLEKFNRICDFVSDTFEITFGNRIMNQIENFTPVFVACGGTKEEALDFMFARKVLRKLEGKFDDYIKDGLDKLLSLITKVYGKDVFKHSEHDIVNMRRKLI